jgi:hypothetical protein
VLRENQLGVQINGVATGVYFVMHQDCVKLGEIVIKLSGFPEGQVRMTLCWEKNMNYLTSKEEC